MKDLIFSEMAEVRSALISILNVESATILGEEIFSEKNPTQTRLDVPWHFNKVRDALKLIDNSLTSKEIQAGNIHY